MKRLCRRMDIPLWQAVGLLESLWHLTARECPAGDIGKLSDEDIALAIDYRGDESAMIEALVQCGWIERSQEFRLVVHDWDQHADDAVHVRLARARLFFSCGEPPKLVRLGGTERQLAHEFYTACAQNGKSCAPCAQTPAPCAPPVPVPVPVPVPEPLPAPVPQPHIPRELPRPLSDQERAISEASERMYSIHPKAKDLPLVPDALEKAVSVKPLAEIEAIHAAWCKTEDWTKNNGRFAPSLASWLGDRGFLHWPNGAEPAPPKKPIKVVPYDPLGIGANQ